MDLRQEVYSARPLVVFVNGVEHIVRDVQPETTVLEYLRSAHVGLSGTKLGCGEGGCGACTVTISHLDAPSQKIIHRSANACLTPLCAVADMNITTVEGIGNVRDGMHPVQEKLATCHGSQCGMCTPGIVMAMYSLLRNKPKPAMHDVEEAFSGNLCRCTGYRPILHAYKAFVKEGEHHPDPTAGPKVDYDPSREPVFPPLLRSLRPSSMVFKGERAIWYRPLTLGGLLELKSHHPEARIIIGNSEIGVEARLRGTQYPVLIHGAFIPELNAMTLNDDGIHIGASVTLHNLQEFCQHAVGGGDDPRFSPLRAILEQLRWFAGSQIRNMACVGGNIATASPISDLNPVFLACDAVLHCMSASRGARDIPMKDFFVAYRRTALYPDEIILTVTVPLARPLEYVMAYKQARRREDDIAIVTSCFRIGFEKKGDAVEVSSAGFAYGGMAPRTIRAYGAEDILKGRPWSDDTLQAAYAELKKDLPLPPGAPGGQIEFRRTLTLSMFYKFYVHVLASLKQAGIAGLPDVTAEMRSAVAPITHPESTGVQSWGSAAENGYSLHKPVMHITARQQVTGEAAYVDDIPTPVNCQYAALVLSPYGHGQIVSVDASAALAIRGVHYVDHRDLPSDHHNRIGPIIPDEELFATRKFTCAGQLIGLIVAADRPTALRAARLVKINYTKLPVIQTMEEAIANDQFYAPPHQIRRGDVDEGFAASAHVIEGEIQMNGQEHFYLETNATLVLPEENDTLTIFASTQNPTKTQHLAAKVLGIPDAKIAVRMKRMGGGFGGKETRSCFISAALAVAAHKLKKPIRIMLDRDTDMMCTGMRHPFMGRYKVGFNADGKILSLKVDLYSNGGNSLDLSGAVMDRALFHSDNAYNIPNLCARGYVCRTHRVSNTAFRGFGGPQGMFVVEAWIDHVAQTLGMSPEKIREINLYQEGDRTHYDQLLDHCNMGAVWKRVFESSSFVARRAEVDAFNTTSRFKKRGLAMIPTKFGMSFTAKFMNQAGALVHVYTDGSVLVSHGGTEMGQGLHTKIAQIVAHAFKIDLDSIHVGDTATDKVANTMPTAASVQSDLNGMAALDACNQINARLKPIRDTMPDASFKEVVLAAHFQRINLSANGFYMTPDIGFDFNDEMGVGRPFNYYVYGAACSEVEVDVLTGDHTVLRSDMMMDVGDSLNPAIDIGQIEGAFVQGQGLFTLEDVLFNPDGTLFTRGPSFYKIPGFGDIPSDFRVSLLDNCPNPRAIHSSKGIGEPPLFMAASVYFAIKDAIRSARKEAGLPTHFQITSPATSERIRLACHDSIAAHFTTDGAVKFAM